MAEYELKLDREKCQSNFVCTAVDPRDFEEEDSGPHEGKAALKGESGEEKIQSLKIEESEKSQAKQAANGCPVLAIELIDEESGEVVAP